MLKKNDVEKVLKHTKEERVVREFEKDGFIINVMHNKEQWQNTVYLTMLALLKKRIEVDDE